MPDYKMDVNGQLGLTEYSNIYDYINIVDKNDNFTITLNSVEERDINMITSMLKDSNFSILEQGINANGNYYINANKVK
ncbi:hypothetical protein [Clostridium isatidis]|uniref:Uncharacterized protein n=1 Tax=Clostridium isatidis TaxID=182773 RepID=A0A343JFI3_9CLOT|nr:hypothetical protein [Clostridium isatidis]ASW44291.1 hypothetical protein BEN51_12780 [Clostridium isatidis]NLZ33546.1 hypothetical protein [Clostridiales bacterium]